MHRSFTQRILGYSRCDHITKKSSINRYKNEQNKMQFDNKKYTHKMPNYELHWIYVYIYVCLCLSVYLYALYMDIVYVYVYVYIGSYNMI